MPKYTVNTVSFIDNGLRQAGDVIDFDGAPGSNLDPLDDDARAAKEAAKNVQRDQLNQMIRDYQPATGGLDQEQLAVLIGAAVAQAMAAQQPAKAAKG